MGLLVLGSDQVVIFCLGGSDQVCTCFLTKSIYQLHIYGSGKSAPRVRNAWEGLQVVAPLCSRDTVRSVCLTPVRPSFPNRLQYVPTPQSLWGLIR